MACVDAKQNGLESAFTSEDGADFESSLVAVAASHDGTDYLSPALDPGFSHRYG